MKTSNVIKNLLTGACVYYAIASLALILLRLILIGSTNGVISIVSFLCLFPFGLAISGAQMIYRRSSLPAWSRLLLHFLIIFLAFFLFLWLPAQTKASPVNTLIVLFGLALVYWIVFLIVHVTVKRFRSFKEE